MPDGFRERLAASLHRKSVESVNGMDLNAYKSGRPGGATNIVHRNFAMRDEVFELGCKLHEKYDALEHFVWLAWMTDACVSDRPEGVIVYHRTEFFCQGAEKHLGAYLRRYFAKGVRFVADRGIERQVVT